MRKRNTRIMPHQKRNHNGRRRVKSDDVLKPRAPTRPATLSCGCLPENVAHRNAAIAEAISKSIPSYEWCSISGAWVPGVSRSIRKRFGRCMRHFDKDNLTPNKEKAEA